MSDPSRPTDTGRNRVGPASFVVGMGLVSALTDVVYEGTRAVIGPFLVLLGASAGTVGLVTGGGEALALVLRLLTGPVADRPTGSRAPTSPSRRSSGSVVIWEAASCATSASRV